MGIGDRSAFPDHLDTKEEVEAAFPDDKQYGDGFFGRIFTKFKKATKHWFAFGPRSPRGIAFSPFPPFIVLRKWRMTPVILWCKKQDGYWRFEKDGEPDMWTADADPVPFLERHPGYYVSRIQYWTRNAKALTWPFFYFQWRYKDSAQVLGVNEARSIDGDIDQFYIGAKRDADGLYWWIAATRTENPK